MAIYYLDAKVISRSTGRSAVAAAAYRSGEILFDERYEKEHDYSRKENITHTEILLPNGAPLWMNDRERLWNEVESSEKRKDAQLARELVIALPKELTIEQNVELIKEYVQSHFVDKGMVADICVHNDKTPEGEPQPHAHVMLAMREINIDGFGKKVREWNLKENLLLWRESWAEVTNRHLALNGHDRKIDHRRLEEQGIELTPGIKVGASVAREHMARLIEQQRISFENGEKIYENPEIALKALTRQQSTFTHHDLAKFVNRHSVDSEQFERIFEKVRSSEHLVYLGLDEQRRDRFTTQEMLTIEMKMADHAKRLVDRHFGHEVGGMIREEVLSNKDKALTEQQRAVFEHLVDRGDIKCVVGYAGTGKSHLLGAARQVWEAQGYQVLGATLSGIAAENLEKSSGIESRTLASRGYYWDKGEQLLTPKDILVIDEAGMISSRHMERLLREVERGGAKVVLVGDPQQLQAIEAGASFRAIAERVGFIELTEVWRQKEEWQREATLSFAQRQVDKGLEAYQSHGCVHEFETQTMAKKGLVEQWFENSQLEPNKTQIMLSYTRKDVQELNEMARDLRKENGELGEDQVIQTERGLRQFAKGDRVYFLENERLNLEVKNGTLGTIEKIEGKELTVRLDRDNNEGHSRTVMVDTERYNKLEYGYAATIHKSQGVTVDKAYVLASKHMDSHATYVGMSRHREGVDLYWSKEEFAKQRELVTQLSRDRSKDVTLDYAKNHGIEVSQSIVKEVFREKPLEAEKIRFKEINFSLESKKNGALRELKEAKEQNVSQDRESSLEAFKKRYEQKHPEKALQHKEMVSPSSEKEMRETVNGFRELHKQLEQRGIDEKSHALLKKELNDIAQKMSKSSELMDYMKQYQKDVYPEVKKLAQEREKELARQKDRGRDLGYELEL